MSASERNRADRSEPGANLAGIGLVHVEKVRHNRPDRGSAAIVGRHRDDAAEYLQQTAIPILDNLMVSGEARINEGAKVRPDRLTSVPVGHAKIADGIIGETVEALAKCLVVDL